MVNLIRGHHGASFQVTSKTTLRVRFSSLEAISAVRHTCRPYSHKKILTRITRIIPGLLDIADKNKNQPLKLAILKTRRLKGYIFETFLNTT